MICIKCGCRDDDCRACVEAQGHPCYWVDDGKCSRCFDDDGSQRPAVPIAELTAWGYEQRPEVELTVPLVCPDRLPLDVQAALAVRDLPFHHRGHREHRENIQTG